MDISQYQKKAKKTIQFSSKAPGEQEAIALHGLVGEVGSLLSCVKKKARDGNSYKGFKDHLTEEVGDTLWYLATIASFYGLPLNKAAERNLEKVERAFLKSSSKPRFYDSGFPKKEQLPRQLVLEFRREGKKVEVYRNGRAVGDPLSDNAYADDSYRYHDVFHMAYAAVLGWSPALRRTLKVKRKSNRKIDEVEDGVRAAMTEELISLFVYTNYQDSHYSSEESIDFSVLQMIRHLSGNLEVSNRTGREWRRAIFAGFEVFKKLRKNGEGFVHYDMNKRTIQYSKRKPRHAPR